MDLWAGEKHKVIVATYGDLFAGKISSGLIVYRPYDFLKQEERSAEKWASIRA